MTTALGIVGYLVASFITFGLLFFLFEEDDFQVTGILSPEDFARYAQNKPGDFTFLCFLGLAWPLILVVTIVVCVIAGLKIVGKWLLTKKVWTLPFYWPTRLIQKVYKEIKMPKENV